MSTLSDLLSIPSVEEGGAASQPPASTSTSTLATLLSGTPVTDTSQPTGQAPATQQGSNPQISGFENVDFAKAQDRDLRNVQRDWIHPSDIDFSLSDVQDKIAQGERQGDFIKLPDTNIFDKYSGSLVYLPEDAGRAANAASKFPDTQLTSPEAAGTIPKDVMDKGRFIPVTDSAGNETQQFISNKDYYLNRLREGGDNPISAAFTAASVGLEMLPLFEQKDFSEMTITEQMLFNEDVIASSDRLKKQRETLAKEGFTGRETVSDQYVEPEGFFGTAWESLQKGLGYDIPRFGGAVAEVFGGKSSPSMKAWGEDFGDKQLARLLKKPELLPPSDLPSFAEGGFKDPRWYGVTAGSIVPTIATTFGSMSVAKMLIGSNKKLLGKVGASSIFSQELGSFYTSLIDQGIAPQSAADASLIYAGIATALAGLSDIRIGKKILAPNATDALKTSFKRKFAIELPKTIGLESGTEGITAFVENLITKWFDEEQDLMDGVIDSFAAGAVGGSIFGGMDLTFNSNIFTKAEKPVTLESLGAVTDAKPEKSSEVRDRVRDGQKSGEINEFTAIENRVLNDYEDSQFTTEVQTDNVKVDVVQYSDDKYSSRAIANDDARTVRTQFDGVYDTKNQATLAALNEVKKLNLNEEILNEIRQFSTAKDIKQFQEASLSELRANRKVVQGEQKKFRADREARVKGTKPQFKAIPSDRRLLDVTAEEALSHLNAKEFDRWVELRTRDKYDTDEQLIGEATEAFTALVSKGRLNEAAQIRGAVPARLETSITPSILAEVTSFMDQQLAARDFVATPRPVEDVSPEGDKKVQSEPTVAKKPEEKKPKKEVKEPAKEPEKVKKIVSTPESREKAAKVPVKPTPSKKKKDSRFFNRVKESLGLEVEVDPTYNPIDLDSDARRSTDFVEENFDLAIRIAKGMELPPSGIALNSISIAVADRLKEIKDYSTLNTVLRAISLRSTRFGQEIVVLRGAFDLTSPEYYIRQVLKDRMAKVGDLKIDFKGKKEHVGKIIKEKATKAKKKIDKKAADIQSAQDIINSIIC